MDGLTGVGSALTLNESVNLMVLNRARTSAAAANSTVTINLNDNSYFNPRYWGIDGANTTLIANLMGTLDMRESYSPPKSIVT